MAMTFDAFGLRRLTTYLIRRRSDRIADRARQFTAPLASGGCALENRHVSAAAMHTRSPVRVCAVERRRFPVGVSLTRQPLQPEATGAVMASAQGNILSAAAAHSLCPHRVTLSRRASGPRWQNLLRLRTRARCGAALDGRPHHPGDRCSPTTGRHGGQPWLPTRAKSGHQTNCPANHDSTEL